MKQTLDSDEEATGSIRAATREEESELAELERKIWEKNSELSQQLTILTTKTNTISEDVSVLYKAGYTKTHTINKIIEDFQAATAQIQQDDADGQAVIQEVVDVMMNLAHLEQ